MSEVFEFDLGTPEVEETREDLKKFMESMPSEMDLEFTNGIGEDTPTVDELPEIEPEITTRMVRNGLTLSDLSNWYDWGHGKWNSRAGNAINKITIHHMAGNLSKARMEAILHSDRLMSCNYAVYSDGTVESFVPELYRSWCSSSWENDKNAITIEVANNGGEPNWPISADAYQTLIELCADLCKRYNINPHYTGKASGTLTIHKMFSATACPGPTLESYITSGKVEKDVKAILNPAPAPTPTPAKVSYRVQAGAFSSEARCDALINQLHQARFNAIKKHEGNLWKVQAGVFSNKSNAENLAAQLKKKGFSAAIITL